MTGTTEDSAIRDEMQRAEDAFVNEDVLFDFDQSVLTPAARSILERKAAWLRNNPGKAVTIEGHCDERGTADYNIALGERRANSARDFLVDLGISGSRLRTVSYGEEQPLDPRHNESAWAKNRRAHFVVR
jgi:peptidoglycan-associated lipoprotein